MSPPESKPATGIYWGRVMHHRLSPRRNHFTYPVFIFAIDLDELSLWGKKLRCFGHNRFSLYTLRDKDHAEPGRTLKESVISLLQERGCPGPIDRIIMVTQFRVLGYLFNPVTFYYCYVGGEEVAYVAEVNNTFHQRHRYVFFGGVKTFVTEKVFYVSPFLEMDLVYHFRFEPLGKELGVFIDDYQKGELVLKTHIVGKHRPLSDGALLLSFLKIPFMSAWILAWIHWQALRLWLKKVPLVFRPHDGMKPGWTAANPEHLPQPSTVFPENS